jgi:hypothetical protein
VRKRDQRPDSAAAQTHCATLRPFVVVVTVGHNFAVGIAAQDSQDLVSGSHLPMLKGQRIGIVEVCVGFERQLG